MITYEGDPRHVDLLLRDCGLEHGKSGVPLGQARVLGTEPACRSLVAS